MSLTISPVIRDTLQQHYRKGGVQRNDNQRACRGFHYPWWDMSDILLGADTPATGAHPAAAVKAGRRPPARRVALTGAKPGRAIIELDGRSMPHRCLQCGNDRSPEGRDPHTDAGLGRAAKLPRERA